MCLINPFSLPCCRRVYVSVARLPSCPESWPLAKCPSELCIQIHGWEPEQRQTGVCWRCKAEGNGTAGMERARLRPGIDKARIVEGLEGCGLGKEAPGSGGRGGRAAGGGRGGSVGARSGRGGRGGRVKRERGGTADSSDYDDGGMGWSNRETCEASGSSTYPATRSQKRQRTEGSIPPLQRQVPPGFQYEYPDPTLAQQQCYGPYAYSNREYNSGGGAGGAGATSYVNLMLSAQDSGGTPDSHEQGGSSTGGGLDPAYHNMNSDGANAMWGAMMENFEKENGAN